MATKLFLRNTNDNGVGSSYEDMVTTPGASEESITENSTNGGTEIQILNAGGGNWISGYTPPGGFILTSVDISIWAAELNMANNVGGRFRVFKRAADGTETEVGGGPFDDGVEWGTGLAEFTWVGNVTDTAFAVDDRILLKIYLTNIGTMAAGTNQLNYNGADGAQGDSFFNIAETVVFTTTPNVGGSSIKTVKGLAVASVKTVNGLAIASVKSINGLT